MKTLGLTKGLIALVDDEDYEWLSQWKWCASEHFVKGKSKWYAVRRHGNSRIPGTKILYLHRELAQRLGIPTTCEVDHIDGNGLNNQRSNIRQATHAQNIRNSKKSPGFTSRYKGVCWYKQTSRWAACVKTNGKQHHLGYFLDEEEAARSYDNRAKILFGDFAKLNFPAMKIDTCKL